MKLKKYLLSSFLLVIVFFLAPFYSFAQVSPTITTISTTISPTPRNIPPPRGGINLNVSPAFINLTTDPGKQVGGEFRVTNNNSFAERLTLRLVRFEADQTGSQPVPVDLSANDVLFQWVKFQEPDFILDPNETKTVRFSVSPSTDAGFGYYFAILVTRHSEATSSGNRAVISGTVAFPVLLEVKNGLGEKNLQLIEFKTSQAWYEYLPINFEITIKNVGNIHVVPIGDIFIDQGNIKNVGAVYANKTLGNVLPNTKRTFTTSWDDGFLVRVPKKENGKTLYDKDGKPVYKTEWDLTKLHKFRIGRYTAHLIMVYDNGERDVPLSGYVTFTVFPWKIVLAGLVILLIILIGLKSLISAIISPFRKGRQKHDNT